MMSKNHLLDISGKSQYRENVIVKKIRKTVSLIFSAAYHKLWKNEESK